jgi:2'-5' RNA ligase
VRLFVALDLPAAVRTALAAWADEAAPPAVRRVAQDNLHVTLAFLGSRDADEAAATGRLLAEHVRPLAALHTAGALWLPPRRPGVLSVALRPDDGLSALQADLAGALVRVIGFVPEARPFRPHVTVGRVGRGTRVDTRGAIAPPPQLSFAPPALTLYRSHSTPGGAHYEPLERVAAS